MSITVNKIFHDDHDLRWDFKAIYNLINKSFIFIGSGYRVAIQFAVRQMDEFQLAEWLLEMRDVELPQSNTSLYLLQAALILCIKHLTDDELHDVYDEVSEWVTEQTEKALATGEIVVGRATTEYTQPGHGSQTVFGTRTGD